MNLLKRTKLAQEQNGQNKIQTDKRALTPFRQQEVFFYFIWNAHTDQPCTCGSHLSALAWCPVRSRGWPRRWWSPRPGPRPYWQPWRCLHDAGTLQENHHMQPSVKGVSWGAELWCVLLADSSSWRTAGAPGVQYLLFLIIIDALTIISFHAFSPVFVPHKKS